MNTNQKRRQQPKTPGYKYSFRLNEEQNIRFKELLCKAGLEHNRNRFSNFG
jgi:bacterial mobilization protein MobC